MRMACGIACSPALMNCDQFSLHSFDAFRLSCSAIPFDRAELTHYAGVENAYPLLPQKREHLFGFFVADDEFDRHGHIGGELEEMLFMEDAVATEAGDRAKR